MSDCAHERRRRFYWTGTMFKVDFDLAPSYGHEAVVNQGMTESCADCGIEIMSDEAVVWTPEMQEKIQNYIDSYRHKERSK